MKLMIEVEVKRTDGPPLGPGPIFEDIKQRIPGTLGIEESSYDVENIRYVGVQT